MSKHFVLSLFFICCAFALETSVQAGDTFEFEDLVGFGGGSASAEKVLWTANGLQVIGSAFEPGDVALTTFIWDEKSGLRRLPYLSDTFPVCIGADLNSNGVGVGWCFGENYPVIHATRWEADGTITDLTPDCPQDCEANAVNSNGTAVGFWLHPETGIGEAVKWQQNSISFLGTLGEWSIAYDIADNGDTIGESQMKHSGFPRAVIFIKQHPLPLGTFPGGDLSGARAVNEKGMIVGSASLRSGRVRGFLENFPQRKLEEIPAPEVVEDMAALDINESNQVVGQFAYFDGNEITYRAFFWQPGMSQIADLNDMVQLPPGWLLFDARGVADLKDADQLPYIVGSVHLPDGTFRPYLLRPLL